MKKAFFYHCDTCNNLIYMLNDSGMVPVCCGVPMAKPECHTEDAGHEKHVPQFHSLLSHVLIRVGEEPHPMTKEHSIQWIAVDTNKGFHIKYLCPSDKPEARFDLEPGENVLTVYSYCNLHGLWCNQIIM